MWRAKFFKATSKLLEDLPKSRFVFLTLTVPNCPLKELRATVQTMNKAWGRLVKRKAFPADGWVKSLEVTRGTDGLAHPHFHIVLMVKPSYFKNKTYVTQEQWTELWKSCLKANYTPIVNVKAVKYNGVNNLEKGLYIALCETLKYSVKEADLVADTEWLAELTVQLHKTRSVGVGGLFKNYLSEEEPEDYIHSILDDEPLESDHIFWFGWREMVQRYMSR